MTSSRHKKKLEYGSKLSKNRKTEEYEIFTERATFYSVQKWDKTERFEGRVHEKGSNWLFSCLFWLNLKYANFWGKCSKYEGFVIELWTFFAKQKFFPKLRVNFAKLRNNFQNWGKNSKTEDPKTQKLANTKFLPRPFL